jgi:hypothetical protein
MMVGAENYDISPFGLQDRRSSSELSVREMVPQAAQYHAERGLNQLPVVLGLLRLMRARGFEPRLCVI